MSNPTGKGGFVKGDPRINRDGRPKHFDELRKLAQRIADEKIVSKDGTTAVSRIELMLKQMSMSGDARLILEFIKIAYGEERSQVDITTNGKEINASILTDDERAARIAAILEQAREARARRAAGSNSDQS